jgi:hypothetical protein
MRILLSFAIIVACLLLWSLPPEPVQVFHDRQGKRIGASTLMGSTTVPLTKAEEDELRAKGHPILEHIAPDEEVEYAWRLALEQMPR